MPTSKEPTRKEIQASFAEYFPQMSTIKLRTAHVLLGASVNGPTVGIERLRTIVYILAYNLDDGQTIMPLSGEVKQWADIQKLLRSKRCFGAKYGKVIIELIYLDRAEEKRNYHLRDFR